MLLLELPPEVLILIFESLPDIKSLYNLTRTCIFAREIYFQDRPPILKSVINNTYSDLSREVEDTISASRSNGELDYSYASEHSVQWIVPESSNAWNPSIQTPTTAINLLQTIADLMHDTESLADRLTPHCQMKSTWHCDPNSTIRQSVINTLLRLQLVTNRLYNVQLPAFPEHVSLKTYEREKKAQRSLSRKVRQEGFLYMEERIRIISDPHARETCSFSRKTRDQARDLMKDQLRPFSLSHLRNMWFLMQMLQDEYLLLRRHRLRPRAGSLMDLLFEHNADEAGSGAWSCSPWFAAQSLLSDNGIHVVPARPGTSFRFLGHETSYELSQKDEAEFVHAFGSRPRTYDCPRPLPNDNAVSQEHVRAILNSRLFDEYLERFRPLLGLPYFDTTPVRNLVEAQAPIRSTMGSKKNWATATSTSTTSEKSLLGSLLQECAERNQRRAIADVKKRLRMGRKRST